MKNLLHTGAGFTLLVTDPKTGVTKAHGLFDTASEAALYQEEAKTQGAGGEYLDLVQYSRILPLTVQG
jgi:hypothetical protein